MEPLLTENPDRFVLFPIVHHDIWAMYKKQLSVIWFAEEVDLSKDKDDYLKRLTEGERHFVKHVLGFFAGSDGIVMENLALRFMREVQWPEAKFFYTAQNQLECVHSETYSLLIDTLIDDKDEKKQTLQSINNFPAVKHKADWALQWIENPTAPLRHPPLSLRRRGGNLLLWLLLRHLLAQEARSHAWPLCQQRAH